MYSPKRVANLTLAASADPELRAQLEAAQRELAALKAGPGAPGGQGDLERQLTDLRKQLALETQLVADLKRSKASLEAIIASGGGGSGGGGADSTMVEDLKAPVRAFFREAT